MSTSGNPSPVPGAPAPAAPPAAPAPAAAATSSRPPASTAATKKKTVTKASSAGTQAKPKKPAAPRRKKAAGAPKATSATQAQQILNDARVAHADLALQKAQQAAKRTDPLWYRMEDVMPAISTTMTDSSTAAASGVFPERLDIVVERALAAAGVGRADVTPQAMACLLEHARRYAGELLLDAQDYAQSAGRNEVMRQDLQLAMELNGGDKLHTISSEIPKLNLIAQQVNRVPLPPIPTQCYNGVLLPPKEHQLTARTFDIVCAASVTQKMTRSMPALKKTAVGKNSDLQQQPAYGAVRGPQIPITIKTTGAAAAATTGMATAAGGDSEQPPTPMDLSDAIEPTKSFGS